MKKTIIFMAFFALAAQIGCTVDPKDEDPKVSVSINTNFGNASFGVLNNYDYSASQTIKLNNLQFFISNMLLVDGANTVKLADILFVDATNNTSNISIITNSKIAVGNYTKLRFGLGVDSVTNLKTPADFSGTNPLANSSWYWNDWHSFTFLKIEGPVQTSFPQGFSYHTSRNPMYREVELNLNYAARINESKGLNLQLDVKKIFNNGIDTININQLPVAHGEPNIPSKNERSTKIADNFQKAWSISN